VDWQDRPCTPRTTTRTEATIEDLVLTVRTELERCSDLGFHGAETIHEALKARKIDPLPSVRTINRILQRRGALDGQKRIRRPAPPPGWHLPEVASKRRELDSFDVVEGLVIKGGPQIEVLNGISLHGGLATSFPVVSPGASKPATHGRFKTSHDSWGVLVHGLTLTGSTFCSKYQTSTGFLFPAGMVSLGLAVQPVSRRPAIARTRSNGLRWGAAGAGGRFGWF
jgi:hypothetical protein